MKFGIMLPHYRTVASTEAINKMSKRTEELGYHSIWVTDLIMVPHVALSLFGPSFYEATAVLSYVAGITSKIRIGASVIALPFRNPIHMAKVASTIDALSNGRLILGVGLGGPESESRQMGKIGENMGVTRGARSDEAIRIFKEMWTSDDPTVDTENYKISDIYVEPRPVQKPHMPIWVGGNTQRALRRTVEFGEVWHPARAPFEFVADMAQRLTRIAERAGRDPQEIGIAPRQPMKIGSDPALRNPDTPLLGTAQEVIDNVGRFRDIGAEYLVLDTFSVPALYNETADDCLETVERFAAEVMPRFKD